MTRKPDSERRPPAPDFAWGTKTWVMGILNVSPDSFSGDGLQPEPEAIAARARQIVTEGADILDLGGQSTRPGHVPIDEREELDRVLPALDAIAGQIDIPVSIDTSRARVAEAALDRGATIINDVRGLTRDPELGRLAAERDAWVVLMHDIEIVDQSRMIPQMIRELTPRIEHALACGIAWERLIIDPGFGFGKNTPKNLELLHRLAELRVFGLPILSGTSRKRTIGEVLGVEADQRVEGTAATVSIAIANGADIVRVHDVREMALVARMTDAIVRGPWYEHTSG